MMIICKDDVIKFLFSENISTSQSPEGKLKIIFPDPEPDLIVSDISYSEAQIYRDLDTAVPEDFKVNKYKFLNNSFVLIT